MRVALLGSNGQLGSDVARVFSEHGHTVSGLTHADIEISNLESVRSCPSLQSADIVVNTAAMHNVEACEADPRKAFAVNALGVRNLAEVTSSFGKILVHISTDYVFDGRKRQPYVEDDAPLPLSAYGNSKLSGEYFVRTASRKHFVLRTSALYGAQPCRAKNGLNFVDLMLKLARERGRVRVVDNEFVSPTPTIDVARQILALTATDAYGLYHATAEGSCSWYEFAKQIFSVAEVPVILEAAAPGEFPGKVPRPAYSVLENRCLKQQRINIFEHWKHGLEKYLQENTRLLAAQPA